MSLQQLADRMNVSKQNISLLEKREAAGGITLNSLRELGKAMDLRLVYGFVSIHESLDEMVERRAKELAKNIVMRTDNSMILEDQKVSYKIKQDNIDALAEEIKREMPRYLWAH